MLHHFAKDHFALVDVRVAKLIKVTRYAAAGLIKTSTAILTLAASVRTLWIKDTCPGLVKSLSIQLPVL